MPLELAANAEGVRYQLSQLDQQIQQILADRLPLLHQLNDLQSSDRSVPNELLSAIFIKACQDPLSEISPIVLGAVCSRWRRIAWDTPPLWSTVGPIPYHRIRQFDVEMLRLYFKNAAQHLIHLNLNLNYLPPRLQVTKDFISVIFGENASKIQKLALSTTNSSILLTKIQRAIECSDLCNLSAISFVSRKPTPISLPLTAFYYSADNLRTLIVDSHQLPPIEQIYWSPITVLKLCHIPVDQCLHILSQCPKLVEFHCHSVSRPRHGIQLLVRSQKDLRDLEIFDVDFNGPSNAIPSSDNHYISISSLFTHFRFPNLKHVVLGTLPVTLGPQFASFLGTMKSLITFECTSFHHDSDLIRVFQHLSPTVKKVYLPPLPHTSAGYLQCLKLIADTIVPSTECMRTVELAFPDYDCEIFTLDLCTVKEEFRKVGVHLKISRFFD